MRRMEPAHDSREGPDLLSPAALPPLGQVIEFMRLIWAVDHRLQRVSRRMEGSLGVTGPQHLVLRIVGRFPGILAGQVATILHVHPSTLTGILKRLERQGLLNRRVDPRDRRRAQLGLTTRGRQLALNGDSIEDAIQLALQRVPESQMQSASDVLRKLADVLDQALADRNDPQADH